MKKSLDKAGWTELCKNYNAEVVNRRAKNKALKDVLKYKTAHLLMLAHGRASEMMMAQHLLKRKLRKFKQFRAYLKDSSKFNFTLPEPRAWPEGKSDGGDDGGTNSGDSTIDLYFCLHKKASYFCLRYTKRRLFVHAHGTVIDDYF